MAKGKLRGPGYGLADHDSPTDDSQGSGRWVACDESGWDGEKLLGCADRFLSIGSVAIDDALADEIVYSLRDSAQAHQGAELKFAMFANGSRRAEALAECFTDPSGLGGKISVYFVDKHYVAASKFVDLLVEEVTYERGFNLYEDGTARRMGRILARQGPEVLGKRQFMTLVNTLLDFASAANHGEAKVPVEVLMQQIRAARDAARPGNVKRILALAADAEGSARRLVRIDTPIKSLEPLVPSIAAVGGHWSDHLETDVRMLIDEQRELTDAALEVMAGVAGHAPNANYTAWLRRPGAVRMFRGSSTRHSSLQLADLVAGAGLRVSRLEVGQHSGVGEILRSSVMAAMDPRSLLPHDDPERVVVS